MSLQLPEGLMQALAAQHGQGAPLPAGLQPSQGGDYDDDGGEPLKVLQDCIQELPKVIAALPDPQDTQDATAALLTLTKIQTRLMNKQQGANGAPQG